MGYEAKILLDSISPDGARLTTMEVTLPRIVLAEFNTHRRFSRNSASSRAIPVAKMLARVIEDPFIPTYWGKNEKGMQASEELDETAKAEAIHQWLIARDNAVKSVRHLAVNLDVHKQTANRILEPWLWHTIIVTATEWENFFALRCNKHAQPEIQIPARMMRDLYRSSTPRQFEYTAWHMPLTTEQEINEWCDAQGDAYDAAAATEYWKKVSAGRCARVSYLTHDGKRDPQADVELCERLMKSGHMSPLEHVARPAREGMKPYGNFDGWVQFRKEIPTEAIFPYGEDV
jgi:thymidylate synthase ThyX